MAELGVISVALGAVGSEAPVVVVHARLRDAVERGPPQRAPLLRSDGPRSRAHHVMTRHGPAAWNVRGLQGKKKLLEYFGQFE